MTKALDKFEKEYWRTTLAALRQSEQRLKAAQSENSNLQVAFQGFAQMLKAKYNFTDDVEIDENGEIAEKAGEE